MEMSSSLILSPTNVLLCFSISCAISARANFIPSVFSCSATKSKSPLCTFPKLLRWQSRKKSFQTVFFSFRTLCPVKWFWKKVFTRISLLACVVDIDVIKNIENTSLITARWSKNIVLTRPLKTYYHNYEVIVRETVLPSSGFSKLHLVIWWEATSCSKLQYTTQYQEDLSRLDFSVRHCHYSSSPPEQRRTDSLAVTIKPEFTNNKTGCSFSSGSESPSCLSRFPQSVL